MSNVSGSQAVLRVLRSNAKRGLTDFQIADKAGLPYESASRRRRELVSGGQVTSTGRTRTNSYGSPCSVWVAA